MIKFRKCPKCGYSPKPGDRDVFTKCQGCGLSFVEYDERRSSIRLFVFLILCLVGISALLIEQHGGMHEVVGAIKSKFTNFSQVSGKITSSEKVRAGKGVDNYEHNIYYGYMVDGEVYTSNTINFQSRKKSVDELILKYPAGKEVNVYYDKNNPNFSVLEPKVVGFDQVYWGLSVFIMLPVLVWFFDFSKHNTAHKYLNIDPGKDSITVNFKLNGWVGLITLGMFGFLLYGVMTSETSRGLLYFSAALFLISALTLSIKTIFDRQNNSVALITSIAGFAFRKTFNLKTAKLASAESKLHFPAGGRIKMLFLIDEKGKRHQIAAFLGGVSDVVIAEKIEEFSGIKYVGYI